jgi:hypothetical protein
MKQLLLRVDDELHARLTAQARARGTSVNALANQILGLGIDPTNLTRTDRLRLTLMEENTIGPRRPVLPPRLRQLTEAERKERARAVATQPHDWIDELLLEQRGDR